jgi:hypothetical protein
MDGELTRQAEMLFGDAIARRHREIAHRPASPADSDQNQTAPPAEPPHDDNPQLGKLLLTQRQHRRLWNHVATIEEFWEGLKELEPGVIARLAKVATERRWELIFLTKRPEGAGRTAQQQTQRWLQSKGYVLPSVFVVQASRGLIATALELDVVIDDRPENCLDVVMDSKARAILVCRDDPTELPTATQSLGITIVSSTNECLDVLSQLDGAGKDEPGVVARVKKLLGLRQSAGA